MFKSKKAFTLPELLVIVAVIGIISGVVFVWIQGTRAKARDAERISNVNTLREALQLYYMDHKEYPRDNPQLWCCMELNSIPEGCPNLKSSLGPYLTKIPQDTLFTNAFGIFSYRYISNGRDYKIHVNLEGEIEGKDYWEVWGGIEGEDTGGKTEPWPQITFSQQEYGPIGEGAGEAIITVKLDKEPRVGQSVSVHYYTTNSTAVAGSDYEYVSGDLIFSGHETEKIFTVPIINDSTPEQKKEVKLALSRPINGYLWNPYEAVLVIADDDSLQFNFNQENYFVGETEVEVTLTVLLSDPAPEGGVRVKYETRDGTAQSGAIPPDYQGTQGELFFDQYENSKTFVVKIFDDSESEMDEFFGVELYDNSPAAGTTLGTLSKAKVTIVDDEAEQFTRIMNFSGEYADDEDDIFYSVQSTPDDGYIMVGMTKSGDIGSGDILVLKTKNKAEGYSLDWSRVIGTAASEQAWSLAELSVLAGPPGEYIVVGETEGYSPSADIFLLKINYKGERDWFKRIQACLSPECPPENNFDSARHVEALLNGGFVVVGTTENFSVSGSKDILLMKFDPAAHLVWARVFGGEKDDYGYSVIEDSSGNYVLTGSTKSFSASEDLILAKISLDGDLMFAYTFGDFDNNRIERGTSLIETMEGSNHYYVVSGITDSASTGPGPTNFDFLIVKFTDNGGLVWNRKIGGNSSNEEAYSIFETYDGGYLINGLSTFILSPSVNLYIVKINSDGSLLLGPKSKDVYSNSIDRSFGSTEELSDHGFVMIGGVKTGSEEDGFLIKFNPIGESYCPAGPSSDLSLQLLPILNFEYKDISTDLTFNINPDFFRVVDAPVGPETAPPHYTFDDPCH